MDVWIGISVCLLVLNRLGNRLTDHKNWYLHVVLMEKNLSGVLSVLLNSWHPI